MMCSHVYDCALSVYHLSLHWVRVCLRCYRPYGELKMVSNQHASTNSLGTCIYARLQVLYSAEYVYCTF